MLLCILDCELFFFEFIHDSSFRMHQKWVGVAAGSQDKQGQVMAGMEMAAQGFANESSHLYKV